MIDLSDGLHDDLGKLLVASGAGARLEIAALPISDELIEYAGADNAVVYALTGGDDYELCFTVAPANEKRLKSIAEDWECAVTRVGRVAADQSLQWQRDGLDYQLPQPGFRHF